jgi:hypothetical protein
VRPGPSTPRAPPSACDTFNRLARMAGARPKARLASAESPMASATTRPSIAARPPFFVPLATKSLQSVQAQIADQQASDTTNSGDNARLHHQLPDDNAAAAAERHARGDFMSPAVRAHQHQGGQIHTGDQQHASAAELSRTMGSRMRVARISAIAGRSDRA